MNFLALNNFDFKKLYTSGVTYERLNNKEQVLNEVKSGELLNDGDRKNQKFLSSENKIKMKKILIEVRGMAFGEETDLVYEFPSYLLKQKLTQIIKERYRGMYTYYKKNDNVFKVLKSKNYQPPNEQVNSIQDSFTSSEDDKYSDIRSENELNLKKIQETHSAKIINMYRNEMGFSLIIEEMINSKKPLIGHNCIYDI